MRDKRYWNFSRSERIATIILAIGIASALAISMLQDKKNDINNSDIYTEEIDLFDSQLSVKPSEKNKKVKSSTRKKSKYRNTNSAQDSPTPKRQILTPKGRESDN